MLSECDAPEFLKYHYPQFMLKVVIMITFGSEMEFLVSDESPYFSHYACEILRATAVACKSLSENVAKVR